MNFFIKNDDIKNPHFGNKSKVFYNPKNQWWNNETGNHNFVQKLKFVFKKVVPTIVISIIKIWYSIFRNRTFWLIFTTYYITKSRLEKRWFSEIVTAYLHSTVTMRNYTNEYSLAYLSLIFGGFCGTCSRCTQTIELLKN